MTLFGRFVLENQLLKKTTYLINKGRNLGGHGGGGGGGELNLAALGGWISRVAMTTLTTVFNKVVYNYFCI